MMKKINHLALAFVALALPVIGAACAEDFPPLNEVEGLRVLAIQADPPAVASGDTTQLSALVHVSEGQEPAYSWSWCPVLGTPQDAYSCLIDEAQFKSALAFLDPDAVASLPSFDLGHEPMASFTLDISADTLAALCETLLGQATAGLGVAPKCGNEINSSVILEVTSNGEKVVAIKDLRLLIDSSSPPTNPTIGELRARAAADESWFALSTSGATALVAGQTYELEAQVPDSASESFTPAPTVQVPNPEPVRERLFVTWFVTEGSTKSMRTSFIDGEVDFDVLTHNEWSLPSVDPLPRATLYVVLQDERGGVVWTERTLSIEE